MCSAAPAPSCLCTPPERRTMRGTEARLSCSARRCCRRQPLLPGRGQGLGSAAAAARAHRAHTWVAAGSAVSSGDTGRSQKISGLTPKFQAAKENMCPITTCKQPAPATQLHVSFAPQLAAGRQNSQSVLEHGCCLHPRCLTLSAQRKAQRLALAAHIEHVHLRQQRGWLSTALVLCTEQPGVASSRQQRAGACTLLQQDRAQLGCRLHRHSRPVLATLPAAAACCNSSA